LVLELYLLIFQGTLSLKIDTILGGTILNFLCLGFQETVPHRQIPLFLCILALKQLDCVGLLGDLGIECINLVLHCSKLTVFTGQLNGLTLSLFSKISALDHVFLLLLF